MDHQTKEQVLISVANALREKRTRWCQRDFIRHNKLGVSQATLSRWESGAQMPPLHVLINLGIINIVDLTRC
ncbi:hypothetical protein VH1709_contig00121-0001 [Vibrio harveyi]|uniref:helix-turn-helix domain-containing protein n=1 Tax=Vibrio harveyi TaxID=669 RepID=UPI000D788764|nr:hypothetical protein VH1709_contig00121-0001 [Vibrio harveyi]HDM8172286.1 helix-turn-helix transcriptional regulator [Vibrio harveyi]